MKKPTLFVLAAVVCLALTGCGCNHDWKAATCMAPKTCTLCGETEGEAAGHAWQSADCTNPETCSRCGEQRGSTLGHEWQAPTCETDEFCTRCKKVQALATGHSYGVWECTEDIFIRSCQTCGRKESQTPEAFFLQQIAGTWQAASYIDSGREQLNPAHFITVHPDGTAELILNPKLGYPEKAQLVSINFSGYGVPTQKGWSMTFLLENQEWWEEEMGDAPDWMNLAIIVHYPLDPQEDTYIELMHPGYNAFWFFVEKAEDPASDSSENPGS